MTAEVKEEGSRLDLTIRVETRGGSGSKGLAYTLDSPSAVLPYHQHAVRGPDLESSPEEFQRRLFRGLEDLRKRSPDGLRLSSREIEAEVEGIGQELFRSVFAGEMERVLRNLPEDVETVLVTSNEPWIPWELLHDGQEFLCLRFRMARWLAGQMRPATSRRVHSLLALRASSDDSEWDETEVLRRLEGSVDGLDGVFERGVTFEVLDRHLRNSEFDLLHFSGHGEHDLEDALDPRILAQDRPFRPRNVTSEIQSNLQRRQPFILLNSCQVGRVATALTGLQGWARTWIESGCAGFLAPSWSVSSASTRTFAEAFYSGLANGLDLGRALHSARLSLRDRHPADLAWLAYVLYGMPDARILLGSPDAEAPEERTGAGPDLEPREADPKPRPLALGEPAAAHQGAPQSGGRRRRAGLTAVASALLLAGFASFLWHSPSEEPPLPRHGAQEPAVTSEPAQVAPDAAQTAPPSQTSPSLPAGIATVPGRVAILPTARHAPDLTRAIEATLAAVDGIEPVWVAGVHNPSSNLAAHRGAELHLFVGAHAEPLDSPIANIRTVSLTLDASLVDPADGTRLTRVSSTHTGAGSTTDAALRQAAGRCLSEIFDTLRERTNS